VDSHGLIVVSTSYHFGQFLELLHNERREGLAVQGVEQLIDATIHIVNYTFLLRRRGLFQSLQGGGEGFEYGLRRIRDM